MAKAIQPIREFWESDKKPDYLGITKNKNGSARVVKFIKQKPKRKKYEK